MNNFQSTPTVKPCRVPRVSLLLSPGGLLVSGGGGGGGCGGERGAGGSGADVFLDLLLKELRTRGKVEAAAGSVEVR